MSERTHGGIYPDDERVDMVISQLPMLGFGAYYVEAVQEARNALVRESARKQARAVIALLDTVPKPTES